ncbi:MFS transporter (facilitated glucose transporter) [Sarotherodon galilaeus]
MLEELSELQKADARAPARLDALREINVEAGEGEGGGKTGEGGDVVGVARGIRSNVAVDLDGIDDILPASLCSPSACPVTAARRESSLIVPGALPPQPTAPPGTFSSPRSGDRTNVPAASTMEGPIAKQQKRFKIKTSAETGGKEVGEMTIEVLQQQEQAGNLSCDSLDRADPHYFNLKSNFHLSEDASESNGSADEFKTVGPKKRAEGRSRHESTRDEEGTGGQNGDRGGGGVAHANIPLSAGEP